MENFIFGLLLILACSFLCWKAWVLHAQHKVWMGIGLLILSGFLLRTYVAADLYLHPWDERYHALVAKNMIETPLKPMLYKNPILPYEYKNWAANHVWVHKQPLPLWVMAGSISLFGCHEWSLRLPSVILTCLGVLLTFLIGKTIYNKRIGFIAAFFYSINGLIIELSGGRIATDHIDVFFLFLIELAVWMALKYAITNHRIYTIFCAGITGLAILTKWLPALIVLPVWILFVFHFKKVSPKKAFVDFMLLLMTIVAVALPWQIYIRTAFPLEAAWENAFNYKHIFEALEGHSGSLFYHFDRMRMQFGEIVYLPLLWLLYKTIKRRSNLIRWALCIWIFIPYLFFSFVETKMKAYTIFAAPALFIVIALFWNYLYVYKKIFTYKYLVYIILGLLLLLPIRYTLERVKPFEIRGRSPQWVKQIKSLKKMNLSPNTVIFNMDHPIETMFYTDFTAYENIPDEHTIKYLLDKGYEIYIWDDSNLPPFIRKIGED